MFVDLKTGLPYTPKMSSLKGKPHILDNEPVTPQNICIQALEGKVEDLQKCMAESFKTKEAAEKRIAMLEEKVSALEGKVSALVSILGRRDEGHNRKTVRVKARHAGKQKADS